MNVAILILFWVLVGWKFALAEFLGGIIIIAVVATGLSLLFPGGRLERLRQETPQQVLGDVVTEDVICGMEGHQEHAVDYQGRTYLFCNAQHARQFRQDPEEYASRLATPPARGPGAMAGREPQVETRDVVCGMEGSEEHSARHEGHEYWFCSEGCKQSFWNDPLRYLKPMRQPAAPTDVVTRDVVCGMEGSPEHSDVHDGHEYRFCSAGCREAFEREPERYVKPGQAEPRVALWSLRTWYEITQKFIGDVKMLRNELIAGYLIAGFAEALIPHQWFSSSLHQIGQVPVLGYVLLLLLGLAIAVATFVCSMGNVPVAQFLRLAGAARREHRLHLRRPPDPAPGPDLPEVLRTQADRSLPGLLRVGRDGRRRAYGAPYQPSPRRDLSQCTCNRSRSSQTPWRYLA